MLGVRTGGLFAGGCELVDSEASLPRRAGECERDCVWRPHAVVSIRSRACVRRAVNPRLVVGCMRAEEVVDMDCDMDVK